jgi:hypothetical protein
VSRYISPFSSRRAEKAILPKGMASAVPAGVAGKTVRAGLAAADATGDAVGVAEPGAAVGVETSSPSVQATTDKTAMRTSRTVGIRKA